MSGPDEPRPRLLLKISGEALSGRGALGVAPEALSALCGELAAALGTAAAPQVAVVVGGGNFLRGGVLAEAGFDRVQADSMGMLATVMNGIALRAGLEARGVPAAVLSAVPAIKEVEPYSAGLCGDRLAAGRVVILVGGTGNPYFTTDTCAALRAAEIGATLLLKGTKVDGVYSRDPHEDASAERFERLSFDEVLDRDLRVMDATAFAMCRENDIPIRVFDMFTDGNIGRALGGELLGTLVSTA